LENPGPISYSSGDHHKLSLQASSKERGRTQFKDFTKVFQAVVTLFHVNEPFFDE
jgi:hypothetical protein